METINPGDTVYLRHATDVCFIVQSIDREKQTARVTDKNNITHNLPLAMLTTILDKT